MNSEFEIIFSPKAFKNLKSLDKSIQLRIKEGIVKLSKYPPQAEIIKLKGRQGNEFRLRVGDWRIIFEYQFEEGQVNILAVLPRGQAYK